MLYGIPSRISVRRSLIWRRSPSFVFPAIGTKIALSAVMVDDTYLVVMVVMRLQVGRRRRADGRLRSNQKLCTNLEEHH